MLKIAYNYADKIQEAHLQIINDEKYKFYDAGCYWDYKVELSESGWNTLEYVSTDFDNNVLGYFKADISRPENFVSSLSIINFADKGNFTFAKDLHKFLVNLFIKFNFYKINFYVIIGNPIEKMYDKFTQKYGGKTVGTFKKQILLIDNKLYDKKYYELFRSNFMKKYKEAVR